MTLLGIVIDWRDEHPSKAQSPILVTLLGIVIDWRDEHPRKAQSPILVTLLDILIFVAFDQQDKICPSDLNNNCPCIKYLELFKTIFLKL